MKYYLNYDKNTIYYGGTENVSYLFEISAMDGVYARSKQELINKCKDFIDTETKYIHATDDYMYQIDDMYNIYYRDYKNNK